MIPGDRRSLEAAIPMETGRRRQESGTGSRGPVATPDEDLLREVLDVF